MSTALQHINVARPPEHRAPASDAKGTPAQTGLVANGSNHDHLPAFRAGSTAGPMKHGHVGELEHASAAGPHDGAPSQPPRLANDVATKRTPSFNSPQPLPSRHTQPAKHHGAGSSQSCITALNLTGCMPPNTTVTNIKLASALQAGPYSQPPPASSAPATAPMNNVHSPAATPGQRAARAQDSATETASASAAAQQQQQDHAQEQQPTSSSRQQTPHGAGPGHSPGMSQRAAAQNNASSRGATWASPHGQQPSKGYSSLRPDAGKAATTGAAATSQAPPTNKAQRMLGINSNGAQLGRVLNIQIPNTSPGMRPSSYSSTLHTSYSMPSTTSQHGVRPSSSQPPQQTYNTAVLRGATVNTPTCISTPQNAASTRSARPPQQLKLPLHTAGHSSYNAKGHTTRAPLSTATTQLMASVQAAHLKSGANEQLRTAPPAYADVDSFLQALAGLLVLDSPENGAIGTAPVVTQSGLDTNVFGLLKQHLKDAWGTTHDVFWQRVAAARGKSVLTFASHGLPVLSILAHSKLPETPAEVAPLAAFLNTHKDKLLENSSPELVLECFVHHARYVKEWWSKQAKEGQFLDDPDSRPPLKRRRAEHHPSSQGRESDEAFLRDSTHAAVPMPPDFSNTDIAQIMTLNIGGERFVTTNVTLAAVPNSLFWALVHLPALSGTMPRTPLGEIFIDRTPRCFEHILDFLRAKRFGDEYEPPLPSTAAELTVMRREAAFYDLHELTHRADAALAELEDSTGKMELLRQRAATQTASQHLARHQTFRSEDFPISDTNSLDRNALGYPIT